MKKFILEIEMEDKTWAAVCRLSQVGNTNVSKIIDSLYCPRNVDSDIKEMISELSQNRTELSKYPEIKAVLK